MLSRVAESIYWMARYIERAENIARVIEATFNVILDQAGTVEEQWEPLVMATGDEAYFAEHYGDPTAENVTRFLTFDRDYSNSVITSLSRARENARTVREAISSEAWEQLNDFYHLVKAAAKKNQMLDLEFLTAVKQQSHLFYGTLDATMSRGQGWHFANLGRRLERADKTSRILDVKYFTLLPTVSDVGTTLDDLQWSSLLRSVSGFEMYRKRFHAITVHRVVEFLVLDPEFPRAVYACVEEAHRSLHSISGSPLGTFRNGAEQKLGRLRSELAYADVNDIVNSGLHEFVDRVQRQLNVIGDEITNAFFNLESESSTGGQTAGQTQSQLQMPSPLMT